jgi:hypothetical protein
MNATLMARVRHLGALWLFGAAAFAATTWMCFRLGVGLDGMGMSLRICRSIIESHGGRIGAGNRAEGHVQFAFTLPNASGVEAKGARLA